MSDFRQGLDKRLDADSFESIRQETYRRGLESERRHADSERRQRHHEVLCIVLKESLLATFANAPKDSVVDMKDLVSVAQNIADLAYPPPKEQP